MPRPTDRKLPQTAREIARSLSELHRCATDLRSALEDLAHGPRSWDSYLLRPGFAIDAAAQLQTDFDQPHALAAALFAQLDYTEEAPTVDARHTLQIPGLLAVPQSVTPLARALNTAKHNLQQLTAEFKGVLADRPTLERNERLRDALADAGYPRTHLRQCYRQILLCADTPDAIALSWVKARKSIRKVTPQWCEKKLVQLDPLGEDTGIQYQRQLLAGLHPNQHSRLRQIQVQSRPNLQVAEIFYGDNASSSEAFENEGEHTGEKRDDSIGGEVYRQVGYSAMPVLVRCDDGRLPEFTRVEDNPPASRRRQRRDLKIDPKPLLPALRVHLHGIS